MIEPVFSDMEMEPLEELIDVVTAEAIGQLRGELAGGGTELDDDEWELINSGVRLGVAHRLPPRPVRVEAMTLTEFLLARISEDEMLARESIGNKWYAQAHSEVRTVAHDLRGAVEPCWYQIAESGRSAGPHADRGDFDDRPTFKHIVRHDPARVLAECEAKRRIVELHRENVHGDNCKLCGYGDDRSEGDSWPCTSLRLLALPHADHPDYNQSWRP